MNSVVTSGFLDRLGRLPGSVRQQAFRAYALWRADPRHPSLQFKRVSRRQPIDSARVGLGHRALGLWEGDTINGSGSARMPSPTHSWPDFRDQSSGVGSILIIGDRIGFGG